MELPSRIGFINTKLQESFYKLEKGTYSEQKLFRLICKAFKRLEENAFMGTQIPKKLTPKKYIQEYDVSNLWKYNLPGGWRLIYTIIDKEIIVLSIILEWLPHKEYEKKFKY
ncbi:MAG: hypothetical protein KJ583_00675 [Nanoarchaeota archaeon]|nr:hypothetical protein [Nanoarchaeota archaeon]MBU1269963.1 hypothetical protein [Nanoarchaeota archaeon]MBU1603803.1 hypothetical protein [Nanoarchaeota archaeon]MBU2443182.1 hypothetical protein [Nanoarchaeota archaeon]